jgi:hypothetical protein
MLADVPQVRLVRKDLGGDLAFWAPLVGLTMEREPEVEQYLRNLVVGRGRSEKTTKDYAGWLVPAIQYRRVKQLSWELFAADMDNFLIWRRALRRRTKGRGMAGPSRQTLESMMTAVNGFYRYGVRHKLISSDVMSVLFEVTDEPALPEHLRSVWGEPALRLRSRYAIRSGTATADRQVRQHREQRRPVTAEEFALLICQVTSARDAFCLALMRYCALRVGQVVTLKRDRIHGEHRDRGARHPRPDHLRGRLHPGQQACEHSADRSGNRRPGARRHSRAPGPLGLGHRPESRAADPRTRRTVRRARRGLTSHKKDT